jgi:hypothetical protein
MVEASKMFYIIILIVVADLGNYLLRKFIAKMDKEPSVSNWGSDVSEPSVGPGVVLEAWGRRFPAKTFIAGPVHPTILALLKEYQSIGPDQYFMPVDRKYASEPFSENSEFLQIGVWGDGSAIVVKRDVSDGHVYVADEEDTGPKHPVVMAKSVNEFLCHAWSYYQDGLRQK